MRRTGSEDIGLQTKTSTGQESIPEDVEVLFLRLVLFLVHVFGEDPERRSWIDEHDDTGRFLPGFLFGLRFLFHEITHR